MYRDEQVRYETEAQLKRQSAQSIGSGYSEDKVITGQAMQPIDRTVEGLTRLMNACHDQMTMLAKQLTPITTDAPGKDAPEPLPPASCVLDAKLIEIAAGLHALENRLRVQRETLCL